MALPGVPQGLPGLGAATFAPFIDALKSVGDAVKSVVPFVDTFHKSVSRLGEVFLANTAVVNELARALGKIAVVGAASAAALTVFGAAVSGLVAKANPAVAAQFGLAVNDLLAVIGQALTPVLVVVTEVVRLFADTLLAVSGVVGGALTSTFQALVPVIESMLGVFAEFAVVAAEVLKATAPLIVVVLRGITDVFKWMADGIKEVLALFGISTGDVEVKKGASVGAAVRSASETSVDAVLSKARTSAFSLGTASGDPAGRTASAAEAIKARADEIYNIIKGLPKALADEIVKLLGGAAGSVVGGYAKAVDSITGGTTATDTADEVKNLVERMRRRAAELGAGPGVVGGS